MILSARGLSYRTEDGRFALAPLDLSLAEGSLVLVRGHNGSGKSTLLKILAGRGKTLPGAVAGTLEIVGQDALKADGSRFFPHVASMGPRPDVELFRSTVREEIAFALENLGLGKGERNRRVDRVASALGIESLLAANGRRLSGGEQRLALLAALLAQGPRILLLDEPLSGLSAENARLAARAMRAHADGGNLVIVAEHALEALRGLVDRELVVERGTLSRDRTRADGILSGDERADAIRNAIHGAPRDYPAPTSRADPGDRERLSAARIDFSYGAAPVLSLEGISVPNGISLLSGANGTGKSTLLRVLRGLERPARGRVRFDGKEIARVSATSGLSLVMQESAHQLVALTVRDEIALAFRFGHVGRSREKDKTARVGDIAERFSLEGLLDAYPGTLSTGERRRLALATAFARGPSFMLLDEADAGLDGHGTETLARELACLATRGGGALCASHNPAFLANLAAREFALERGSGALTPRRALNA